MRTLTVVQGVSLTSVAEVVSPLSEFSGDGYLAIVWK